MSALKSPHLHFALLLCALASPLSQANAQPSPDDMKAIEVCLAASDGDRQSCIGKISEACGVGARATPDVTECNAREREIWEAMIEADLARLSKGSLGTKSAEPSNRPSVAPRTSPVTGREIMADMDRSWRAFRILKCDMESLQGEGGSYGRILYASCLREEAGRHALWLRALREEVESR
jgi:hypothetical protein